jgi:hypothetical protein
LITLCIRCHAKTNSNRSNWIKFFEKIKEVLKENQNNLLLLGGILVLSLLTNGIGLSTLPFVFFKGDTFGYTGVGSSSGQSASGSLRGNTMGNPPSAGSVDSISVHCMRVSGLVNLKAVIVELTNKTIVEDGIGGTVAANNTSAWRTMTYSSKPTFDGTTYYAASYVLYLSSNFYFKYDEVDDGSGTYIYDSTNDYDDPEDPTDADDYDYRKLSLYATYTPSGGEDYKVTVTDSLSLKKEVSKKSTFQRVVSDDLTLSDSVDADIIKAPVLSVEQVESKIKLTWIY